MWHLPTIRAIAATTPEGAVMLATRPTTRAKQLLAAEPAVAGVYELTYHAGAFKRLREAIDFYRLCRRLKPRAVWVLEKIGRPAIAAALAGVSERRGFGLGHGQERWLTHGPFLPRSLRPAHRIVKLAALEAAHGLLVQSREAALRISPALKGSLAAEMAERPRPWTVFGVGASSAERRWPLDRFAAVARALPGTVFWLGGPEDAPAVAAVTGPLAVNISNWPLDRAAALLAGADLFIGGDSGPMNLSAAVGCRTLCLFGASPPLDYSAHITALGDGTGGMEAIGVEVVVAKALAMLETSAPSCPGGG
jgi:heptosyltransferase-2